MGDILVTSKGMDGRVRTHGVATVVMKNCDPLVFFPALAMERSPGSVCFKEKFSSAFMIRENHSERIRKLYTTKFGAVYRFSAYAVVVREISTLNHKLARES